MSGAPLVDTGPELIEREQECAILDALVDRLRDRGGASSHLAMVSHPAEVARLIEAAANVAAAVK